jgi:hypothetical protein
VAERPVALPPVTEGAALPITSFLNRERFDPETVRVMGVAFEMTRIALRIVDADDGAYQLIANKIIKFAKAGEHNPDLLCEQTLDGLGEDWHHHFSASEHQNPAGDPIPSDGFWSPDDGRRLRP